jgi:hypothetical protein
MELTLPGSLAVNCCEGMKRSRRDGGLGFLLGLVWLEELLVGYLLVLLAYVLVMAGGTVLQEAEIWVQQSFLFHGGYVPGHAVDAWNWIEPNPICAKFFPVLAHTRLMPFLSQLSTCHTVSTFVVCVATAKLINFFFLHNFTYRSFILTVNLSDHNMIFFFFPY